MGYQSLNCENFMKIKYFFLLAGLSCLIASCASVPAEQAQAGALPTYDSRYDLEKMARYENASRRAGTRVYWLNAPTSGQKQ
jgi:hypothetical protein